MSARRSSRKSSRKVDVPQEEDETAMIPVAPLTPSRVKRVEEKEELQSLNKRLEFYILSQREKDAARDGRQREVDALREGFERQTSQLRQLHEAQIKVIRKNRDEKLAENAKMKEDNSRQTSSLEGLKRELKTQQDYKLDLEVRNAEMTSDLQTAKARQAAAEEEVKRMAHDLALNKNQNLSSKGDLSDARGRADDVSKKLTRALSKTSNLEEDYQMLADKHAKETDRYSRELAELSRNRAEVEDSLRKEFARQLKEILAERQATYEEEKQAGLEALSGLFEDQLAAKRKDIKALEAALDSARGRNGELGSEVAQLRNTSWEAQKEALESSVSELSEQLRQSRQAHESEVSVLCQSTAKEIASLKIDVQELTVAARNATANASRALQLEDDVRHFRTMSSTLKAQVKDSAKVVQRSEQQASRIAALVTEQDHLKGSIDQLQAASVQHEKAYTALLDVKVALDMEIAAYRELLSREEERLMAEQVSTLPHKTPVRKTRQSAASVVVPEVAEVEEVEEVAEVEEPKRGKRKRGSKKGSAKKTPVAKKPAKRARKKKTQAPESLAISEIDLEKNFLTIENVGAEPVVLDGWTVMAEKSGAVFRFPDASPLAAGAEVTLFLGTKSKKGKKKGFSWTVDAVFNVVDDSGDACIILDPTGGVISRCAIAFA